MTLTEEFIRKKGKKLGQHLGVAKGFSYSDVWLHNFKRCYGIKSYALHGEAGSADQEGINLANKHLRDLLEKGGLQHMVFTMKKRVGCFGDRCPRTMATGKRAGRKKEKERVTFSVCCNATGTHKMSLLVIGKAARPRSFPRSFDPKRDLVVRYANNKSAWLTKRDYARWVGEVKSEMRHKKCKVVLLTDKCTDTCASRCRDRAWISGH
jgi:hypothetical protein